jgi:hypothetical protein
VGQSHRFNVVSGSNLLMWLNTVPTKGRMATEFGLLLSAFRSTGQQAELNRLPALYQQIAGLTQHQICGLAPHEIIQSPLSGQRPQDNIGTKDPRCLQDPPLSAAGSTFCRRAVLWNQLKGASTACPTRTSVQVVHSGTQY